MNLIFIQVNPLKFARIESFKQDFLLQALLVENI